MSTIITSPAITTPTLSITPSIPLMQPYKPIPPIVQSPGIQPMRVNREHGYSELSQLLQSNNIKRVRIQQPVGHSENLPRALVETRSAEVIPITLSPDTNGFSKQLEQKAIPYQWEKRPQSAQDFLSRIASLTIEDVLIPMGLIAIALGGLTAWQGKMDTAQKQQEIYQTLTDYHKRTKVRAERSVEDVLAVYPDVVKNAVHRFQHNQSNYLIAVGPPGTGKTFLLNALTAETKNKKTLVLDIGSPDAFEVRQLLIRLYGGNERERQLAMQSLNRLVQPTTGILQKLQQKLSFWVPKKVPHFPFDTILLIGDEIETVSADLDILITKAFDNPRNTLPTIKLLASANVLPDFSAATRSRLGRSLVLVDYCTPQEMKERWLDWLAKQDIRLTEKDEKALLKITTEYPGYSLRTLFKPGGLAEQLKHRIAQEGKDTFLPSLEALLKDTPLEDNEIAGLVRYMAIERVFEENRIPANEQPTERMRLALVGLQANEDVLRNISMLRSYNGKEWIPKIKLALNINKSKETKSREVVTVTEFGTTTTTEYYEVTNNAPGQSNDFQTYLEKIYASLRDNRTK